MINDYAINGKDSSELLSAKEELRDAEFRLKAARERVYNLQSGEGYKRLINNLYPVPEFLVNRDWGICLP